MKLKKCINKGSYSKQTIDSYKKINDIKDYVYNISYLSSSHPSAKKRKTELENIYQVRMGPKEYEYLNNQLSITIGRNDPKKIQCYLHKIDIDPVCFYSKDTIQNFLMANTNIDNRLACLVQDIIEQEYAQLVMLLYLVFS